MAMGLTIEPHSCPNEGKHYPILMAANATQRGDKLYGAASMGREGGPVTHEHCSLPGVPYSATRSRPPRRKTFEGQTRQEVLVWEPQLADAAL